MANTKLTRNMTTQGSAIKGTFSAWVKRSKISLGAGGVDSDIYQHNYSSDYRFIIIFTSDDKLRIGDYRDNAGGWAMKKDTNALYRDTNAWYHIYVAIDRSLATAEDRQKLYVNGERITSWSSSTDYSQQTSGGHSGAGYPSMNNNYNGIIGGRENSTDYFDGLMSHLYWVDGSVIDIAQFGSTDSTTGEWKINTSPTIASYGTNGHSHFKDVASVNDASSNNNHFTSNGAGITKTEDNPSNVFATLNPLHMSEGTTGNYYLSTGNLRQHVTNNDGHRQTGFTLHPKGLKGYFEFKCTVDANFHLGIQNTQIALGKTNYYTVSGGSNYYYLEVSGAIKYTNGGSAATHVASYLGAGSASDIYGCAFDFTGSNKNIWIHKNGTYGNNGGVGNPATGANPGITATQLTQDEYEFIFSPNTGSGNNQTDFNFGNGYFGTTAVSSAGTNASNIGIFEYNVPTGFTALSTKGLNE